MVRIWCLPVASLDRQHLLGEHVELHVIVNAILRGKGAWFNHPQTIRFKNHLGALIDRHEQQVAEMQRRGYKHNSPLPLIGVKREKYQYPYYALRRDLKLLRERGGIKE